MCDHCIASLVIVCPFDMLTGEPILLYAPKITVRVAIHTKSPAKAETKHLINSMLS